jgi:hypothetical protein
MKGVKIRRKKGNDGLRVNGNHTWITLLAEFIVLRSEILEEYLPEWY